MASWARLGTRHKTHVRVGFPVLVAARPAAAPAGLCPSTSIGFRVPFWLT